jgi:hypothetical protein
MTRNEKRTLPARTPRAARAGDAERIQERWKPKGHGQVWTKEEIERMLKLEIIFQGGKCVVKEMRKYFPNKQIRDKTAGRKYRSQLQQTLVNNQLKPNNNGGGDDRILLLRIMEEERGSSDTAVCDRRAPPKRYCINA